MAERGGDAAGAGGGVAIRSTQSCEYAQSAATSEVVNFALGQPGPRALQRALELVRECTRRALLGEDVDATVMQYARVEGYGCAREGIARFLADAYSENSSGRDVSVSPQAVTLTAGVSHGLDVCARALVRRHASRDDARRPAVLMEEPTYFLARRIFLDAGLVPVPVPTSDSCGGVDVDALERLLAAPVEGGRGAERGVVCPVALYCIPTHHNPCGTTLSPEARQRLVDVCASHRVVVLADDVYQLLSFPGEQPPPPLRSYDAAGNTVVSLGSFAKILTPSLRLGWVEAGAALTDLFRRNGVLNSGGALSPLSALIVREAITGGELARHIAWTRAELQRRCDALCAALARLTPQLVVTVPSGGYFVWARVPDSALGGAGSTGELLERAAAGGVRFCPGALCSVDGDGLRSHLRFSFAFYEPDELEEGVRRLRSVLAL